VSLAESTPGSDGASTRRKPSSGLSSTASRTLDLFREGRDLEAIAAVRGLTQSTIEGHLADAIEYGEVADVGTLVAPDRQRAIELALEAVGADYLTPIRKRLGDDFSYGEIRLARAAYLRRQTNRAPSPVPGPGGPAAGLPREGGAT